MNVHCLTKIKATIKKAPIPYGIKACIIKPKSLNNEQMYVVKQLNNYSYPEINNNLYLLYSNILFNNMFHFFYNIIQFSLSIIFAKRKTYGRAVRVYPYPGKYM